MKKLTFMMMFFCFFIKTENAQAQNCEFKHSYFWYNNSEEMALDNSCGAGEMFYGRSYKQHSIRSQGGSDCWLNCIDSRCSSANTSSSKCLKCTSGYLLKDGLCETCPTNASCNGTSSFSCRSGYWLQNGTCTSCPANATCNGSSTFTCNSGYTKSGSSCMQDKPKNTVSSCPSRMTLSSDGCCCINK